MPVALGLLGGCQLSPGVEAEEEELASEGSISIDAEGEGGGGANTGCAIYIGIPLNGASGLKKGPKTKTMKER